MKKILFIDRDGTIINEHETFQIDRFDKLVFYPKVFAIYFENSKECSGVKTFSIKIS